ncbi:putative Intraflagellar transport protein 74-like protein [Hypsibius exemplaris]|uniref:Intraflagellar transport protein 74-like protein n=1 Tax=Hypsibius exemplaris TaxID=2072580 RepID=A0A1W0WVP2_HYPEX|nr:putative Intraflagellar transport protein 74-like protein [Hypsibius exemplaris]
MSATGRPPSARPGSSVQPAAARPGTASRLAAQAAASSKAPSTAARPGTGRGSGAAVTTGPSERLRTARGLQSAKGRPRIRNTRDRAYFIGALRSKLADIINETNRLRNESKEFAALRELSATTHGEYQALAKTVADLRGTQHDYEAMLESVAKGVTNDDLHAEIEDLQQQNGFLTAEVQELLNERESREGQLKKLQDRTKKYETAGEALLREMSEEDQVRYREMQRELEEQTVVEERLLSDYEAIRNGERAKLEEELMFSPLKKEAAQVYGRLRDLQSTLDDLKAQTGQSPEQEQRRLMEKTKSENAEIAALERQSVTLRDVLETMQQQLGGRDASASHTGQRDDDRQHFLATYRNQYEQLSKDVDKLQGENLRSLDQLSKNVQALNELPITTEADLLKSGQQLRSTVAQVKQDQRMRGDLLQMNVEERSRELRKLESLLETLTTEKATRQADIVKWENASKSGMNLPAILAKQNQEKKEELLGLERKYKSMKDALDKAVGELQRRQTALEKNPSHQKINAAELQLQQISAQTFEAEEAATESLADTSYENQKVAVLQKAKQINDILQRLAQLDN